MKNRLAIVLCTGLCLTSSACADAYGISNRQALIILLPPLLTLLILLILSWRYAVKGERFAVAVGSFFLWLFALCVIPLVIKIRFVQYAVNTWPFEAYIAYFAVLIIAIFSLHKWRRK